MFNKLIELLQGKPAKLPAVSTITIPVPETGRPKAIAAPVRVETQKKPPQAGCCPKCGSSLWFPIANVHHCNSCGHQSDYTGAINGVSREAVLNGEYAAKNPRLAGRVSPKGFQQSLARLMYGGKK